MGTVQTVARLKWCTYDANCGCSQDSSAFVFNLDSCSSGGSDSGPGGLWIFRGCDSDNRPRMEGYGVTNLLCSGTPEINQAMETNCQPKSSWPSKPLFFIEDGTYQWTCVTNAPEYTVLYVSLGVLGFCILLFFGPLLFRLWQSRQEDEEENVQPVSPNGAPVGEGAEAQEGHQGEGPEEPATAQQPAAAQDEGGARADGPTEDAPAAPSHNYYEF